MQRQHRMDLFDAKMFDVHEQKLLPMVNLNNNQRYIEDKLQLLDLYFSEYYVELMNHLIVYKQYVVFVHQ
jgi:hypothetical protein